MMFSSITFAQTNIQTEQQNEPVIIPDTETQTILNDMQIQNRISNIGFKLLNANKIDVRMAFVYNKKSPKLKSEPALTRRQIVIYGNSIQFASDDNEIAAFLAREICKGAESYSGQMKGFVGSAQIKFAPKKYEMFFDKRAVDFMVKAGYNPLAMIVVITKHPGSFWEILTGKPANAERAMNVYDYLTYNYPSKVKAGYGCNEYRAFLAYADPIVEKRNSNAKKLEKFNKEQQQAKAERAANIAKYKATGGLTGWDATYTILKNLSESSER